MAVRFVVLAVGAAAVANAFTIQPSSRVIPASHAARAACSTRRGLGVSLRAQQQREKGESEETYNFRLHTSAMARDACRILGPALPAGALMSQIALPVQEVFAKNAEYGLLEGKAAAMIHPVGMGVLYLLTLYTGYLGLQWRKIRDIGDQVKELQEEQKGLQAQVQYLADNEQSASVEDAKMTELAAKIQELNEQRKQLVSGNYRDKHWMSASLLLASGVTISIEGAFDTYFRAGKLFPGPHLFAGAAITVLWAIAASLVPQMQKGSSTARSAHIAINTIILGLFTWQLPTGWKILDFVWNKTPWVPIPEVLP